jgi:hypothetical protein
MDSRALPEGFAARPVLDGPLLGPRPLNAADRAALTEAAVDPGILAEHPVPDRWRAELFGRAGPDADQRGCSVSRQRASAAVTRSNS